MQINPAFILSRTFSLKRKWAYSRILTLAACPKDDSLVEQSLRSFCEVCSIILTTRNFICNQRRHYKFEENLTFLQKNSPKKTAKLTADIMLSEQKYKSQ